MNSTAAKTRPAETPVPLAPAPSGAGVDILTLTEDDLFLLTVRKVVRLPNRIWHATSDTQAADILLSTPCAAVLADISLMHSQLPATIRRLRQQFPDLAFVVAGEPENEGEVAPLIQGGDVQSFISKQNAPRQLASALQLGVDRHFELHTETRPASGGRGKSTLFAIGAGIAAAIALIAAAVWLMTGGKQDATPQPVFKVDGAAVPTTPPASPAVEHALEKAREAFEAGRYLEPGGSNDALDHYRAALSLDPVNAEAKDGLSRITEIMLARTELALVEGNMRAAAEHLKSARAIDPSSPRITFLETQISRETARTASAQQEAQQIQELNRKLEELSKAPAVSAPATAKAAPPAPTPQQRNAAEADRLLALGYERLSQNRLLQPAEDNAPFYFQKVKQLQPDHASLEPALTALRTRLLAEAEASLAAGNAAQAGAFLDGARNAGAGGVRVEQLSTQVSRAALQAQLLATPRPLQESMLKKRVEPDYPSRARRENVEGAVELRITVSRQGEVKDVLVVNAQPQGYFEEAAMRAVKRWKIEPKTVDGETYEQLLSLRLRFKLEK